MKRRAEKKRAWMRARKRNRICMTERDMHDKPYLLAFMRAAVHILARQDTVDQKVLEVAAIARRLAPAIAHARTLERLGKEQT